jgi:multidrug efflux pump subunit AcrA (membrane-fusion protein)
MIRFTILLLAMASAVPGVAAVPFETVIATLEDAARERVWDGRVEAVNQATVSAQTSGRIAELPFDVNDYVEAGAVLMRFTDWPRPRRPCRKRLRALQKQTRSLSAFRR